MTIRLLVIPCYIVIDILHVNVVIRAINCYYMLLDVVTCYWLLHGLHFQSIIRYEYVFVLCSSCI